MIDTLGVHYNTMSSKDTLWTDVGYNLAIFAFFKIMQLVSFRMRTRRHLQIAALAPKPNEE